MGELLRVRIRADACKRERECDFGGKNDFEEEINNADEKMSF